MSSKINLTEIQLAMKKEKEVQTRKEEMVRILRVLRKLWLKYPSLRLGQLIFTLSFKPKADPNIFYIRDKELLEEMKKYI